MTKNKSLTIPPKISLNKKTIPISNYASCTFAVYLTILVIGIQDIGFHLVLKSRKPVLFSDVKCMISVIAISLI